MATDIGIGFSQKGDPKEAAREAAFQANLMADQPHIQFVIVLATIHYDPHVVLTIVQETFPQAKIIGSSTAGILLSDRIATHGIAILALSSSDMHFGTYAVEDLPHQDIRQAGFLLGQKTVIDYEFPRRQLFLFFVDSMIKDSYFLLKGLQEVFGNVFPIIGAGSSDNFHLEQTYQFYQNRPLTQAVTGVLMGGQMGIGFGSKHGWMPLGKPRFIDEMSGSLIRKIDRQPAAHIYQEYFGEEMTHLMDSKMHPLSILYPLGIYLEEENEYLLRTVVQIHEDGSMACQGAIPSGAEIHIMMGNKDACQQAAFGAAIEAHQSLMGKKAQLVLVFESMTRYRLLGRNAIKEMNTLKEVFGSKTPILGMYTFGEFAPFKSLDSLTNTHLQNGSFTVVAIG